MQYIASLSSQRGSATPGRDHAIGYIEALLDPSILTLSIWLLSIHGEGSLLPPYLLLSVLLFAMTFPGKSRLHMPLARLAASVACSWLWTATLLIFFGLASRYINEFSSEVIVTWLWVAPLAQFLGHVALRKTAPLLIRLQGEPQRAIVVGLNEQGLELIRRIDETRYLHIDMLGFFDDRAKSRLDESLEQSLLGRFEAIPDFVKKNGIQLIYLALPMASQPRILQILDDLKDTTASIYFVPDIFVTDLIQGRSKSICGMPIISVCETPFTGANGFIKRTSDVMLSLLILLMFSPLIASIAIAVKTTSAGPIIFRQRRYGLDGKEIYVYKFRSMSVCEDEGAIRQAQKGDSRITPLGRFLRKTSLDELPQFINVLQGHMSIVGPRPHAVAHNELYRKLIKGYMIRHKVKPGITGWAQVNGYRGETETLDKMQARINHDLDYLRNWSIFLDLRIIFRTIAIVFHDNAAY